MSLTAPSHGALVRRLRTADPLVTVVAVGVAARALLIPITHGADFTVWDLASRATLDGVNVYAHHPAYSGGPFSYFPLFLYVEVPMQWLALHTGVSFTVWGKLPIVGGDVLAAVVIASELARDGLGRSRQAIGAALFFLNPLVLYNGAFYGRFDSLAVALLLLAFAAYRAARPRRWAMPLTYALAVAVKTFPVFVLAWPLRRDRRTAARVIAACVVGLVAISAPYLATSPGPFVTDLMYSAGKLSGGLSWQVVLHGLPTSVQLGIADALLAVFVVGAIVLAATDDYVLCTAATLLLFVLLSKQVIEQYLVWPLPFLVLLIVARRSRPAAFLVMEMMVAALLDNAYFHPFGLQPPVLNVAFGLAVAATLYALLAGNHRQPVDPRTPRHEEVPRDRIELSTPGFSDPCSTD